MKHACSLILLLFYFRSSSPLKCPRSERCLCLPGTDFEFQCPSGAGTESLDFVIHIKEGNEILIDCVSGLEKFNINNLPNITIDEIDKFRMRFCPLPENGFKEVLDHFSLKRVKFLQFGSSDLENVTLTKDYFEGLHFLESLQLNACGMVDVAEDVFANIPNLTSLDLEGNNIILKPDLFHYVPKLKELDISENQLQSIPEGLFRDSGELLLLHLWGNNFTTIENHTFKGLSNLKSLELRSNKIGTISDGAFKHLVNLVRLNLSSNKFTTLPSDTFSRNDKMELIVMRNNHLELPDLLFANLPALKECDLTNSKIESLPENIFHNSPNITNVKLGENKLKLMPYGLFTGIQNLKEIHLDNNKIERIGNVFASLDKLNILSLINNEISEIGIDDFKDLSKLEQIFLRNNKIRTIDPYAFQSSRKLKIVDLSNNLYTGEFDSSFHFVLFDNLLDIETINLSHNRITRINDVFTSPLPLHLNLIDLSYNQITNIALTDLQPLQKKLTVNLENNNITMVDFDKVDLITQGVVDAFSVKDQPYAVIYLAYNPIDCDCHNYDLVRYFQNGLRPQVRVMYDIRTENVTCASPPQLQNMLVEQIPQRLLVCHLETIGENDACPDECSCSWRPSDRSLVVNCSQKNFTEVPEIDLSHIALEFAQTEMHLEGNDLSLGPDRNSTGYDNVTKLYMSHNKIKKVTWLPPKLQVLHLDNNKLSHLDYEVLNMLNSSTLDNLTLNNNPWSCDCSAENFTNFLRQHTKVDSRHIHCFNTTKRLTELNRNDLCQEIQIVHLIVGILIVLLGATLILVFYYRHQQALKVWLYAHNICMWWVTEEELDKDKIYDAFISYSHKDEEFVVQNLLPVLEGGPKPYKLCLHYRNWIPGEFISTQVTNSVLESRRTLVVLSPNFLESVWGKMEFRTAHTQAMTEGRARVIIVLYGEIDVDNLDEELKSYMKTNTYVKWGDPYFWNKLKYALPHSRSKISNNNQKIANVMNCIDDKFNLVAPVTGSPGTTPPVLSLDSHVLKKHPLNFVSSAERDTPPAESGTLLVSTCL